MNLMHDSYNVIGMDDRRYKFTKKVRLSNPLLINFLFEKGKSITVPPLKVLFVRSDIPGGISLQALFTVSVKKFRRAVDRNRIRRKLKEVYRLNRHLLSDWLDLQDGFSVIVGIIYIGDIPDPPFLQLEKAMITCMERLKKRISQV